MSSNANIFVVINGLSLKSEEEEKIIVEKNVSLQTSFYI